MRLLLTGILPGILALAVMAGCQALTWLAPAEKHSPLPPEIDRLVMEPVMRSVGVNLSDEQLTLFQTELMEAMNAHEGLSVLEVPPSYLPNTAVMAGVLRHYQFSEQWRGGGFLLRSIVLTLDFIVRPMEGKGELSRGSRTITWQKVYPPEAENPEGAEIPEADEDLKAAVRELGAGLAENQRPVPLPAPIVVDDAREIGSGKAWGVPALLKGNRYARGGVYEQARSLWRVVLFNPEGNEPAGESLYRLTDRSLALLMQHGWSLEQVAVIEPLTRLGPLTLEDYREQLRQLRKGRLEDEGLILAVSEFHRERLHYNAGAAHGNLGMLFALEARYDLATYHLARAYLHNPAGGYLERWAYVQKKRGLLVPGLEDREALNLYLQFPPPQGALLMAGDFERRITPKIPLDEKQERELPPEPEEEQSDPQAAGDDAGGKPAGEKAGRPGSRKGPPAGFDPPYVPEEPPGGGADAGIDAGAGAGKASAGSAPSP